MNYFFSSLLFALLTISFVAGYFFPSTFTHNQTQPMVPHQASKFFQAGSALPDFSTYTDVKQKKADFFMYLLPMVQSSNGKIKKERSFILSIQHDLDRLSQVDQIELQHLIHKYKVKSSEGELNSEAINELLKRVNIIPASLVLAQAANESAWGTSRFATKGNNLFGQWCYVKGCGLVPQKRGSNENHEVAKFDTVQASIESYMLNLNSQFSYEDLRNLRASTKTISGHNLAEGLLKYSTRREAYVHEIQAMIRQNSLSQYDYP